MRAWASVPSQSFRRTRPRAMQMATPSRRISRHRRTTRKTALPLPIRPRTPKTNRRAPIPLRPTVARRPARPTQAKRPTVLSRARATRRATPRRERAQQTAATAIRVAPHRARHLTVQAKARHRATRHLHPQIGNRPVQRARIDSGSRPFALGAEMASPVRW